MSALIVGHSFVRRSRSYIIDNNSTALDLKQFVRINLHGFGGMKIKDLSNYQSSLDSENFSVLILDIGCNDISDWEDAVPEARKLFDIAAEFARRYNCKVYLIEQFYRIQRQNNKYTDLDTADWNTCIRVFNLALENLSALYPGYNVILFKHKNLTESWFSYLKHDGVHLNDQGQQKWLRVYRGALIHASRH